MQIFNRQYVCNLIEAVTKRLTAEHIATLLRVCSNEKFHSGPDVIRATVGKLFSKAVLRLLYQKDLFTMGGRGRGSSSVLPVLLCLNMPGILFNIDASCSASTCKLIFVRSLSSLN